jgi:hypothetical protein
MLVCNPNIRPGPHKILPWGIILIPLSPVNTFRFCILSTLVLLYSICLHCVLGILLNRWATTGFSKRTVLQGVAYFIDNHVFKTISSCVPHVRVSYHFTPSNRSLFKHHNNVLWPVDVIETVVVWFLPFSGYYVFLWSTNTKGKSVISVSYGYLVDHIL